jgi:hypothetical protein
VTPLTWVEPVTEYILSAKTLEYPAKGDRETPTEKNMTINNLIDSPIGIYNLVISIKNPPPITS